MLNKIMHQLKNPVIISSPIDAKNYNVSIPVPPEGQELSISTRFHMKNFQYKLGQGKIYYGLVFHQIKMLGEYLILIFLSFYKCT